MENNYCVYMHMLKSDGRKYIGITWHTQYPNRRWRNGLGYKQGTHFRHAISKYGWNSFKHEILFKNLTKEQACNKEKALIKLFNTQDPRYGFNVASGGDGYRVFEISKVVLEYQYITLNKTKNQCAEYFGCSKSVIENRIQEYNLKKSKEQVQDSMQRLHIDGNILYHLYIEKNWTCAQCALYFQCAKCTITKYVERYGFHKSPKQKAASQKRAEPRINKADLIQLYIIENKSVKEVAAIYKCSISNISRVLHKYNVKKRVRHESTN